MATNIGNGRFGRAIAYQPRLGVALHAGAILNWRGRSKLRPSVFTERLGTQGGVLSATDRAAVSSSSYNWQTSTQNYPARTPRAADNR